MLVYNVSAPALPCYRFRTGVLYRDRVAHSIWDPTNASFIHHKLTRPETGTWVEVTHCSPRVRLPERKQPSAIPGHYWTYLTPGSGIRVNVGRTIGFAKHSDAARSMNVSCTDFWCTNAYESVFREYGQRYDTMFFHSGETAHRCKDAFAIEIVFLNISGRLQSACVPGMEYRNSRFQRCQCHDREDGCISCSRSLA